MMKAHFDRSEYRSMSATHMVFLVSLCILHVGGVAMRLACGISNAGEELVQTGLALIAAGGIVALAHYVRLLDRFPRKYPATAAVLTMAAMLVVAFHDNTCAHLAFHSEVHIMLAVIAVSLTIYASREMGMLGLLMCLAAMFCCVFIVCGAHDDRAAFIIVVDSLLFVALGVGTKWFKDEALWLQLFTLAAAVTFSYAVMCVMFPDTQYYIWQSLFKEKIIPIPDVEWLKSNNPILSYNIMANAKLIGSSGVGFPLQEDLKWHLFNIIAYKGGQVALAASLLPVAGLLVSGFILAIKHRGLRRLLSFGVMTWASVGLIGYVLFCFGINYWQSRNVPILSAGILPNALLFVGFGVVLSTKREQCFSVQPNKLYREHQQFWDEFPERFFDGEDNIGPNVSLWIEDVTDGLKSSLRAFFNSGSMVKTIDLNKLEEAFPTAKNCAVFRCCSLLKHADMPMLSFVLTRDHNFLKVVASPRASMESILSLLTIYNYGCTKETDFCIELDEAIDVESVEIYGVGI